PNIIGLKDASNNISATADFMACRNEEQIYSGNDDQILPILSLGGAGVISVLSNIAPYEVQNICKAYFEGNTQKAAAEQLRLLPLIRTLFSQVNPMPINAAMKLIGRDAGDPRLPLVPCDEETIQRLKAEIARADLIY
ncbi:MAG: dihydrodipicolinate synthase family protein, partial [Clostridia bacterium]|nr:dihydrodipicolinate synthase family protein [Clostridia bacterium]